MLSEQTIHKIGRIDQVIRDYFEIHTTQDKVPAKDLMDLFVEKKIFNMDYSRPGKPIRDLLRELDANNKLSLLKHCKVVRHKTNRYWYFERR